MLDIKFIRENPDVIKNAIKVKQLEGTVDIDELLQVDTKLQEISKELDELRRQRNELDKQIKFEKDLEKKKPLIEKATELKPKVNELEEKYRELKEKFDNLMLWVPNVPADDVPIGEDESGNVEIKVVGEIPNFDFEPKNHVELIENLKLADTKRGTKIGGFRAYFMTGKGAILEQAILRYAYDFMIKQGFTPMNVPVMVKKEWLVGTGYFPWGQEDHYGIENDMALIGTAEVSLTAYHANEVLDEKELPVKMVGISPCFRREVGSHGKDTKGIFRVHYFNKVEQVVLLPQGEDLTREWHDRMLGYAEQILQDFGLPYHVLLMCTGDMGAGQRKKYDIEVWFPGEGKYRETHSDSYFLDFQARRLNMRYTDKDGNKKYMYTLNNTVAATPRLLAGLIENYQQKDGSVVVPEVLRKYTGFDVIEPE